MIPKVKTWRARTVDGSVYYVRAPTRVLALLNLRHAARVYDPIKSLAPIRSKPA